MANFPLIAIDTERKSFRIDTCRFQFELSCFLVVARHQRLCNTVHLGKTIEQFNCSIQCSDSMISFENFLQNVAVPGPVDRMVGIKIVKPHQGQRFTENQWIETSTKLNCIQRKLDSKEITTGNLDALCTRAFAA